MVIGKMTGTCECSTTSTELDNKCRKIAKTLPTESFDLEV